MPKMKYAVLIKENGELVFTAIGTDAVQARLDIAKMLVAVNSTGNKLEGVDQAEVHGPGIPLTTSEHDMLHKVAAH